MLNATVKSTKEIVNLNQCARNIAAGEFGKVVKSVELPAGFQLLVKFEKAEPMLFVQFKNNSNRNSLEIVNAK